MLIRKHILILLVTLSITQHSFAQILISYSFAFKIKSLGSTVNGSFNKGIATILLNKTNPTLSIFEGTVEVNSINTGLKLRDKHLKDKEDFFDVAKHPIATIKSAKVESKTAGNYEVTWNITIKGITKSIKSIVTSAIQGNITIFKTEMKINRNDWNIGGKSIMMGDVVTILLSANTQE